MRFARTFRVHCVARVALLAAAAASAGCARNAIDLVDLDYQRLPPNGFSERVRAPQCYWWIEGERLHVAAAGGWAGLKPATKRCGVDLSFVFSGLPAESARYYTLDTESLRAYVHDAPVHARYRSLRGIAGVWLQPGGGVRVRFRVAAQKEMFNILTGWSTTGETMLTGALVGREDATRGQAILARSEKDEFGRTEAGEINPGDRSKPVQVTGPALNPRGESDK